MGERLEPNRCTRMAAAAGLAILLTACSGQETSATPPTNTSATPEPGTPTTGEARCARDLCTFTTYTTDEAGQNIGSSIAYVACLGEGLFTNRLDSSMTGDTHHVAQLDWAARECLDGRMTDADLPGREIIDEDPEVELRITCDKQGCHIAVYDSKPTIGDPYSVTTTLACKGLTLGQLTTNDGQDWPQHNYPGHPYCVDGIVEQAELKKS